jgi:hypothetical protein
VQHDAPLPYLHPRLGIGCGSGRQGLQKARLKVVPQGFPEHFVQDDPILPKAALAVLWHLESQAGCDDRPARPTFPFFVFPEKLEGACGDPCSLLA